MDLRVNRVIECLDALRKDLDNHKHTEIDALRRDIDTLRLDMDHHGHIETEVAQKPATPESIMLQESRDAKKPYGKPATAHLTEQEIAQLAKTKPTVAAIDYVCSECGHESRGYGINQMSTTPPALDVEGVVRAFVVWHFDCDNEQEHDEIVAVYMAARKETK